MLATRGARHHPALQAWANSSVLHPVGSGVWDAGLVFTTNDSRRRRLRADHHCEVVAREEAPSRLTAGGAIVAFSLGVDWLVSLSRQAGAKGLEHYWRARGGYPPLRHSVQADFRWMASATTKVVHFLHITGPRLALVLMICGVAVLAGRRPWSALMLALPVVIALGAALTDRYPLAFRLALYLYPLLVLLLAAPLSYADRGRHSASARSKPILVVFALGLVVTTAPGIATGLTKLVRPDETESGRQAIAFVARHQRAGDLVLAELGAHSALRITDPVSMRRWMASSGSGSHVLVGASSQPLS